MHHLLRCHVQAHQLYLRELRGLEASAKGHSGTVDDTIWLQVVVAACGFWSPKCPSENFGRL